MAENIKAGMNYHPPVDSEINLSVTPNFSEAYVTVEPPKNGGAEITVGAIMNKLAENKVVYGILNEEIERLVNERRYDTRTLIARWTPAVNGIDGTITYNYEKEQKLAPVENENGFVDYKNLGLIRTVYAGDVIADITLPTEGEPGTDLRGVTIRQKPGKKAAYSVGLNTALNEEGTQIVATADGNINFKGGAFVIDPVVTINGDVDASVGNIVFTGDVVVKGEVLEGFKISSNSNITVAGNVNGAILEADGNIIIKKGCINSTVTAHGSVTINFCEHSTIKCDGDLISSNFVICDVYCGGQISTKGNTGGLLGGKYTSINSVEVSNIGTKNYTPTLLTIGDNALLAEEKEEVNKQIEKAKKDLENTTLVINFLNEKKKQLHSLPEDKEQILGNACRQKVLIGMDIQKLQKRVAEIDASLATKQFLSIKCRGYIYPGVKIIINDAVFKVESEYVRSKVSINEDGMIAIAPL